MPMHAIDFGRPIPLFPLGGVSLMPHAMSRFHIFEPRYRQMVEHMLAAGNGDLERADPVALAVLDPSHSDGATTSIREVACIGRITRLERYPDGRFDLVVHGVSRARIDELDQPEADRLYLRAWMRPIDESGPGPAMPEARRTISGLLRGPRLARLSQGEFARQLTANEQVPTQALIDLIAFAVFSDPGLRYRVLADADCRSRAATVTRELQELDRLVELVDRQEPGAWPKGLSWN